MFFLRKIFAVARELPRRVFPPVCLLCSAPGDNHQDLCRSCKKDLPTIDHACRCCAIPLPDKTIELCGQCLQSPPPQHRCRAPFRYDFPIDGLIKQLKFQGRLPPALLLGQLFLEHLPENHLPQALIPIPLHPHRLRQRGFNQAMELARPMAHYLNIPLLPDSLRKIIDTPPQSRLSAQNRQISLQQAFTVHGTIPYEHVALVDDVITTGSTIQAAGNTLLSAGVKTLQVWVIARTI